MCEEVWSNWMLIYFYMPLSCLCVSPLLLIGVINFLALPSMHVCSVA
jgi:hypothetical protein